MQRQPIAGGKLFGLAMLVGLAASLVFIPGINGPFFFDDDTNLLGNLALRLTALDWASLHQAAFSMYAGPLQRPVSMASFAINYFFAGGFDQPAYFKAVNIVIHVVNGILLFFFARFIVVRAQALDAYRHRTLNPILLPGTLALLWFVHPIQLTSVLYTVQRMTELAALFTLLALLGYAGARKSFMNGQRLKGAFLIALAFLVCWPLGLFSKETAVLLPVFVATLEYVLFYDQPPWARWNACSPKVRRTIATLLVLAAIAAGTAVIVYALPQYELRTFTLGERLMTQPRALLFYISLILVPRLDAFGLFHDDIALSTSPFSPWTTLPAMAVVAALVAAGVLLRKKAPLVGLGLLWFFSGHLLESTVIALELVHEHRNYLPLFGALLAIGGTTISLDRPLVTKRRLQIAAAISILVCAGVTTFRSVQWSSEDEMAYYESVHHPNSAASLIRYANSLLRQGRYHDSLVALQNIDKLAPYEAGYLMSIQKVRVARGEPIDEAAHREIQRRLAAYPVTATTLREMLKTGDCITTTCSRLQPYFDDWTQAVLNSSRKNDLSFFYFLRGRTLVGQGKFNEAVDAYRKAYELDNNYMNPLIDLVEVYLAHGRSDFATVILEEIRKVNARSLHKRDSTIKYLSDKLEQQQAALRPHAR